MPSSALIAKGVMYDTPRSFLWSYEIQRLFGSRDFPDLGRVGIKYISEGFTVLEDALNNSTCLLKQLYEIMKCVARGVVFFFFFLSHGDDAQAS